MIEANTPEWHAARRRSVGASEVPALFGKSPHEGYYSLWMRKAGIWDKRQRQQRHQDAGHYLEDGIARWAAADQGWRIQRDQILMRHPRVRLSATPDYRVWSRFREQAGRLEIKNRDWIENTSACPVEFSLQLQAQLACSGEEWGAVAALVGGNRLYPYEMERHPVVIRRIEDAVDRFWQSIDEDRRPEPDFAEDGEAIADMFGQHQAGLTLDLSHDNYIQDLIARFEAVQDMFRSSKEQLETLRAELFYRIGAAERVICGDVELKSITYPGQPDKLIDYDDVGTIIPGRSGARRLYVNRKRKP